MLALEGSLALELEAAELVRRIFGVASSSLHAVEGTVDALVVDDHRKSCREEAAEEIEWFELCEGECLIAGEEGVEPVEEDEGVAGMKAGERGEERTGESGVRVEGAGL